MSFLVTNGGMAKYVAHGCSHVNNSRIIHCENLLALVFHFEYRRVITWFHMYFIFYSGSFMERKHYINTGVNIMVNYFFKTFNAIYSFTHVNRVNCTKIIGGLVNTLRNYIRV